jgi:hypothetical protein
VTERVRRRHGTIWALALLSSGLLSGCHPLLGPTLPDGYEVSSSDFDLALPDTLADTSGAFDIEIGRRYITDAEEFYLRKAESIYPVSARSVAPTGEFRYTWAS